MGRARRGQIENGRVRQKRFADGLNVGVRERGGVKGECEVFGLSNRESLEFIPEAVGSHRKMLRLEGEGTGSDAIITKEAARTENTGLGDRP